MDRPFVPYVIRSGDYLDKLAHRLGFDADAVWNHPKNDELRKLRKPHVLASGDILYVPKEKANGAAITKETTNRFVADVPTSTFEIRFEGMGQQKYTYTIEGRTMDGMTDAEGKASFELPITCTNVHITFPDKGLSTTAKVGHLDPIDESSGVRQRLRALGYITGPRTANEALADSALKSGLRAFQAHERLPVTGTLDDTTKTRLEQAHGS